MSHRRTPSHHPVRGLALGALALAGLACSDSSTSSIRPTAPSASAGVGYSAEQFDATASPKFTAVGGATPLDGAGLSAAGLV